MHATFDHSPPHKYTVQHNHNYTVFVDLTSSSGEGRGLSCYLSAHPRLPTWPSFACFAILLQCKALRGEINFNQSHSPAALGKRVCTPQFWWTRTQLCDFGVKSQARGPWIVPSDHHSIKGGDVRHTHPHAANHLSWGAAANWIF